MSIEQALSSTDKKPLELCVYDTTTDKVIHVDVDELLDQAVLTKFIHKIVSFNISKCGSMIYCYRK